MEYILDKEQKVKKLSSEDKSNIAKKIVDDFKIYDRTRQSQLEKANKIKNEIFFKNVANISKDRSKKWKSVLKICKLFMYHQILKAFIWKNTYANTNSMFDVSGESLESDENSNKQKTALVDILEKMEYSKTLDKVIDKSLIYGELITFSTWKKHSCEYRRPINFFEAVQKPKNMIKMLQAKAKGEKFYIDEKVIYDNPFIYDVDPLNFVFDSTQKNNWETCPKVNRSWKTPQDIISNKYYEISSQIEKDLKELVKKASDESDLTSQNSNSDNEQHINGTTIEVLEHWGDLTLPDGVVLRNWYAVVIAGKYLVQFEKNPFIINPFSYGAYIEDIDNKRGISPLFSIYDISLTQEDMLRRTMDMQSLTENPPVYSPKGFFGDEPDDIEIHPGKVIEYDNNLYANIPIKPMEFAVNVFKEDLSYLDDVMSEISGVFPNMAGATESDRTTATEISTKVEGQLTRLKMLLDVINQYLILDNVKKIAQLKANFTFGNEAIYVNNVNKPENVVIDDKIRQAEYRYTYADRSATSERFNYVDMVAQAMQMFIKSGLQANVNEIFIWYMEQKGVENPERFIQGNFIEPQVQQALLQNPQLAPIIQEMQKRVEMARQGQKLPDNDNESFQTEKVEEQGLSEKLNSLPGRNLLNG